MMAPAAIAVALLAVSAWIAEPLVGYLTAGIIATVIAAVALRRYAPPVGRLPLAVALVAVVYASAVGVRAQVRLGRFSNAPERVGSEEAATQRERLRTRMDEEMLALHGAAERGHAIPHDSRRAVAPLERGLGDLEHRAVLVLHGDTLVAWAGTLHANAAQLTGPSGVVLTPFGLTIYVADDRGPVRTVAASLLYALTPADRITRGVSQRLASDEITEGFDFAPPTRSPRSDELAYSDRGRPLFIARALVPSVEEVRFRMLERARVRVGVALLFAMFAFLVSVARRGGSSAALIMGSAVVLACIAIIPLSEFSTRSRMFDASVYYLPAGRSWSANAAALALTAATGLLLALLVVRRLGRRVPRRFASVVALLTVTTGPFAVRALARGIAPSSEGAGGTLWMIWDVPLCLAATALLILAHSAGRRVLGGRRGLPISIGPVVALVAAVLAQRAWQAPGQWPQWYTALWALAVAAIVLSRPSRRSLLACAMVAALGATTVVWGSASRGRVELAERDVRGLARPDAYAVALTDRLAVRLANGPLPTTPQELLEKYVTSDLASAGYPVALRSWRGMTPIATFGSAPMSVAYDTVGMVAAAAQAQQLITEVITRAGVYGVRVVAVPMQGGAVTIVVAPRTRLIGADPYARWYGLAAPTNYEPPYTVQVVSEPDVGPGPKPRDSIRWRREGSEL